MALVLAALCWGSIRAQEKVASIVSVAVLLAAMAMYSVLMLRLRSVTSEGDLAQHAIWVAVSGATAAVFVLLPTGKSILSDRVAWMYVGSAVAIVYYTAVVGGLQFDGFPKFVYDLINQQGVAISYSQGVSKFYGLAAVFATIIASQSANKGVTKWLSFLLAVLFLAFSFLGGGRGDFAFAILVSLWAIRKLYLLIVLAAGMLAVLAYPDAISGVLGQNQDLFDRYAALNYSLGMRDQLLIDSLNLLIREPGCLIFGCGIGFFQSYYGYPQGMYPHNVPVEFLISFGLIIASFWLLTAALGIEQLQRRYGRSPYFKFMVTYFLLVSLKSGTIASSFLLVGTTTFLCVVGLPHLGKLGRAKVRPNG